LRMFTLSTTYLNKARRHRRSPSLSSSFLSSTSQGD
jgi:hypothetical protein